MEKGVQALCFEKNGNLAEQWKLWRQKFENYLVATETNKKPEEVQCAQLLHYLGDEALQIYNSFTFEEAEKNKIKVLIEKFDGYFIPKKNLTYERYKFFNMRQGSNESIEQFVTELKNQAKQCEFADLNDDLVKTTLITGMKDEILREKLLQNQEKQLQTVIQSCIIWENTKIQNQQIRSTPTEVNSINKKYNAGNQRHMHPKYGRNMNPNFTSADQRRSKLDNHHNTCMKCGKYHSFREKCPAYGKTCNVCKKLNHFGYMCNKNKYRNKNVNAISNDQESNMQLAELNMNKLCIDYVGCHNRKSWHVNLVIKNVNLSFKVDTGSDVNVINLETFNYLRMNKDVIKPTSEKLYDYNNKEIHVIGKCNILTKYNNVDYNIEYFIVGKCYKLIIGLYTSEMLGLINRVDVIQSLNKEYEMLVNQNRTVFQGIGKLGKPYKIELKDNTKPVIQPIRKVPFALENQFKNYLCELEKLDIIEKVQGSTEWLNSFVIVKKVDGSLRICLDPKDLNSVIKRQTFKLPTIDEIAVNLKGSRYYTILDATSGFWNIPLDEESSKLCTFGTPMGRYRFKRLPFGIVTASEVFQERFQEMFNMQGVEIYIDDILIHGKTKEEHDDRLKEVMELARKNNVKFNLEKCKFGMKEVTYLGYKFSEKGIMIDEEKLKPIKEMPTPTNKKELQRFLGLVTYVGRFVKNLSEKTAALRLILKGDNIFMWNEEQQKAFNELKKVLISKPCLQYFDPKEEVTLSVDASKNGVGAVLMQRGQPCAYASRAMTETQTKYAQIEKELLAICFGVDKFHQYCYGKRFIVETDHKPLISIFKKKLNECPARLQRMLLTLQRYDIDLRYKPGKELIIADTLSRANLKETYQEKMELETQICMIVNKIEITDDRITELVQLTEKDEELQQLKTLIEEGWPLNKKKVPEKIRHFYKFRHEITQGMGLIFKGNKIIIPKEMRSKILDSIHKGHFGINKCIQRANTAIYWPGMNTQIENYVSKCEICQKYGKSNIKEPLMFHKIEEIPWYKLGMDIFELYGENYLLLVDYYSKYVEVENLNKNLTARNVIQKLKSIFSRQGIPAVIITDSGTQLISRELRNFSDEWKFKVIPCSPHHQNANGLAERSIQTIKKLMKKTIEEKGDIYLALLTYRNTPVYDSYTPSQLLMSRMLRDNIPRTKKNLQPKPVNKKFYQEKMVQSRDRYKKHYDRHTKIRQDIRSDEVYYQEKPKSQWKKGRIIRREGERSYTIENETGRTLRRNRHFLKNRYNNKFTQRNHFLKFDELENEIQEIPEVSQNNVQNENCITNNQPNDNNPDNTNNQRTRLGRFIVKPVRFRDSNFVNK